MSGYGVLTLHDAQDFSASFGSFTQFGVPGTGFTGFGVPGTPLLSDSRTSKYSQEFRLSAPLGAHLDALVGVFYTHEFTSAAQILQAEDAASGAIVGQTLFTPFESTYEDARLFASQRGGAKQRSAGNLTGVWAESNTREAIYDALRRRETFATSGSRIRVRLFGGWGFDPAFQRRRDWVRAAYAAGVPMGGDLPARHTAAAPRFLIWAVKDPNAATLDRVQVIKVWEKDGESKKAVYDVAWSGNRRIDTVTGKLPADAGGGAAELEVVWTDPDFDERRYAAYYLRVLEIPTPRWTTLLAAEHGLAPPSDVPAAVQQRAWSSPIWYSPSAR